MRYWILKSEPSCYSIDDLRHQTVGMWDGVRNYQARNLMRDAMKSGDRVLFYHSSTAIPGVAGIAEVVREAYPDPTQFKKGSEHYDPQSKKHAPRWSAVDVRFVEKFDSPVSLHRIKNDPFFDGILLTKRGNRLSVQPIGKEYFDRICTYGREGTN